jgi:hypothetical protein
MRVVQHWGGARRRARLVRGIPFLVCTVLELGTPRGVTAAEVERDTKAVTKQGAAAEEGGSEQEVISLAAYNVKADRIEDFGLRVDSRPYHDSARPNVVTIWFTSFAPVVTAVLPNTAASRAGVQPGDRILKSDGQTTVGKAFSTGKYGRWSKAQKKKWADVSAGKTNVTWTLELESPGTKTVRTVKLVIPTPAPRWGASIWKAPEGRTPSSVSERGPLTDVSRRMLDHGIWSWIDQVHWQSLGLDFPTGAPVTGYHWMIGQGREGRHAMIVIQTGGRTHVIFSVLGPMGAWEFLTSPAGVMFKAGRWHRGKLENVSAAEARALFEHELDLWTTKVGQVSPRWPFEVKPGHDPDAFFATLAPKRTTPAAAPRTLAADFLKLTPATEAEKALFAEAYGKLGAEADGWAYTETSRGIEDKRVLVTRVDPSKPEAERAMLLSIDGKPPTAEQVQHWRDDGGDVPKALGDIPPLASLVDLKELRLFKHEEGSVVFEVPLQGGSAEFPADKFQALFRVNKTQRAFEEITVRIREAVRVAGVVKVTGAGLQVRFQAFDSTSPPQPVYLRGGGTARIMLVKIARDFETTRTDFRRVEP